MPARTTLESLRAQISAIESGSSVTVEPDSTSTHGFGGFDGVCSNNNEQNDLVDEPRSTNADSMTDESNSAFQKILALLNASDKPEKAIRERLAQSGFTQDAINHAVTKAKGYGYIDDARYAEVLIRSRLAQGKGSAGIERELAANNIDLLTVEGWPSAFDVNDESEIERALAFLERKPPRSKNPREAAYRKLISKGYSSSIASKAARIWHQKASGNHLY